MSQSSLSVSHSTPELQPIKATWPNILRIFLISLPFGFLMGLHYGLTNVWAKIGVGFLAGFIQMVGIWMWRRGMQTLDMVTVFLYALNGLCFGILITIADIQAGGEWLRILGIVIASALWGVLGWHMLQRNMGKM